MKKDNKMPPNKYWMSTDKKKKFLDTKPMHQSTLYDSFGPKYKIYNNDRKTYIDDVIKANKDKIGPSEYSIDAAKNFKNSCINRQGSFNGII